MKVPGIEEMIETGEAAFSSGQFVTLPREEMRRFLLAVFETHVKGMLAEAWLQCVTKIDGSFTAFDERDANEYADRAMLAASNPKEEGK